MKKGKKIKVITENGEFTYSKLEWNLAFGLMFIIGLIIGIICSLLFLK